MLRSTLLALVLALVAAAPLALPAGALAHPSDSLVDQDHDGVQDPPVGNDNCAGGDGAYNPTQADLDRDARGDACDVDDDGDSVDDAVDNCPLAFNAGQSDLDGDAIGDACDGDDDGDGFADGRDNCRFVTNPGQTDTDRDGLGDACDETTPRAPRPADPPGSPGSPGPSPPGGGAPGAPDTTQPRAIVTLSARHRTAELGAGLAVPVACSERCTLNAVLTVSARDARRLKLRGRVLGSGGAELEDAGSTFVFIDLPRSALRRVRGRGVRVVLRTEVADAAGNRDTVTRRLTIRS